MITNHTPTYNQHHKERLRNPRVVTVGDKGADSLDKFWKRAGRAGITIEYVATDLSSAFYIIRHGELP